MKIKNLIILTRKEKKNRPICPECGEQTIVMFSPVKDGIVGTGLGYKLYHDKNWQEYCDWSKAHLYCCNGSTNCKYTASVYGTDDNLTTP